MIAPIEQRPLYYSGLRRLRYGWTWVAVAAYTLWYPSVGLLLSFGGSGSASLHTCAQRWGAGILRASGVYLQTEGTEQLDPDSAYVYVANHHSLSDIPALLAGLPGGLRMFAKHSLFNIPFLGWYMRRAGYIPVRRDDPRGARRSLRMARQLLSCGTSVLLFPEGTRSPEGQIGSFHEGAFLLARMAKVAIVPVAIRNSGRLLPRGSWRADPGILNICVGKPIPPVEQGQPRDMILSVRQMIVKLVTSTPAGDCDRAA